MKIFQKLSVFVVLALGFNNCILAETILIHAGGEHRVCLSVTSPSGHPSYDVDKCAAVSIEKETGTYHYNATLLNRNGTVAQFCTGSFAVNDDTSEVSLGFYVKNSCHAQIHTTQSLSISSLIDECVQRKIAPNRETCTGVVFESKEDIAKAKEHYKKSCNNKEAVACTLLAKHTNDKLQQFDLYLKSCDYDGGFVRLFNGQNEKLAGCTQAIEIMSEEKVKFNNGQSNHLKQIYNKLCSVKKHKEADQIAVICNVTKKDLR